MLKNSKIKALTYDTGGTILDWHSGFKKGFENIKTKYELDFSTADYANLMRKFSLNFVTKQDQRSLINFDEAHKLAVEKLILEKSLEITNADKFFLYNLIPTKLKAWPDFLNAFNLIKNKYYCVSFTLLSNRLVYINSKNNSFISKIFSPHLQTTTFAYTNF